MSETNHTTATTAVVPVLAPEKAAQLAVIEYRIHDHMTNAAGHLLGVGQCLNEAKVGGLVPHGEWEAWVLRNTGFTVRQAQRMMNAARQVPEGSALAQLPFTKIQACLQLPSADEAEAMAQRVQDEGMTLRQLQDEVKKERQRADQIAAVQVKTSARAAAAEHQLFDLRAQLAAAEARAQETGQDTAPISAEAQAQIDDLRAQLEDAEAMIERQAELRQQAQQDLLNFQAQAARGEISMTASGMTPTELAAAVQAFVGTAGVLPHMGMCLAQAPDADRQAMRAYVDMVAEWVDGARRALQTVYIDGDM